MYESFSVKTQTAEVIFKSTLVEADGGEDGTAGKRHKLVMEDEEKDGEEDEEEGEKEETGMIVGSTADKEDASNSNSSCIEIE